MFLYHNVTFRIGFSHNGWVYNCKPHLPIMIQRVFVCFLPSVDLKVLYLYKPEVKKA